MKHHMMHEKHHSGHHSGHALYRNEVEKPVLPMEGHMMHGEVSRDYKGEADPIAYGQAGMPGFKSDMSKIHSQGKDYHWS